MKPGPVQLWYSTPLNELFEYDGVWLRNDHRGYRIPEYVLTALALEDCLTLIGEV